MTTMEESVALQGWTAVQELRRLVPLPIQYVLFGDEFSKMNVPGMCQVTAAWREAGDSCARLHQQAATATTALSASISGSSAEIPTAASKITEPVGGFAEYCYNMGDHCELTTQDTVKAMIEMCVFAAVAAYQVAALAGSGLGTTLTIPILTAARKKILEVIDKLVVATQLRAGAFAANIVNLGLLGIGFGVLSAGLDLGIQLAQDRDHIDWKSVGAIGAQGVGAIAGGHLGASLAHRAAPLLGRAALPVAAAAGGLFGVLGGAVAASPIVGFHLTGPAIFSGLAQGVVGGLAGARAHSAPSAPDAVPIPDVPPVIDKTVIIEPTFGDTRVQWNPDPPARPLKYDIPEKLVGIVPEKLRQKIPTREPDLIAEGKKTEERLADLFGKESWVNSLHQAVTSTMVGRAYTEALQSGHGGVKLRAEAVKLSEHSNKRMLTVEITESSRAPRVGETSTARHDLGEYADRHRVTTNPDGTTTRTYQFFDEPHFRATIHGETMPPPSLAGLTPADQQTIGHLLDIPADRLLPTHEILDHPIIKDALDKSTAIVQLDDGSKVTVGDAVRTLSRQHPELTDLMQWQIPGWDLASYLTDYTRTWVAVLKTPESIALIRNAMRAVHELGVDRVLREIGTGAPDEFPLTAELRAAFEQRSVEASTLGEDAWRHPIPDDLKQGLNKRDDQIYYLIKNFDHVQNNQMVRVFKNDIGESTGATHYEGRSGHKPAERTNLKLLGDNKIHDDPSLVYDMYAATLRYKTLPEIKLAVDALYSHPDLQVGGFDNRMTRREPTEAEKAERREKLEVEKQINKPVEEPTWREPTAKEIDKRRREMEREINRPVEDASGRRKPTDDEKAERRERLEKDLDKPVEGPKGRREPTDDEKTERREELEKKVNEPVGGTQRSGLGDLRLKIKIKESDATDFDNAFVTELQLKLTDTAEVERSDHPVLELMRIIDSRVEPGEARPPAANAVLKHMQHQTRALWKVTVAETLASPEVQADHKPFVRSWKEWILGTRVPRQSTDTVAGIEAHAEAGGSTEATARGTAPTQRPKYNWAAAKFYQGVTKEQARQVLKAGGHRVAIPTPEPTTSPDRGQLHEIFGRDANQNPIVVTVYELPEARRVRVMGAREMRGDEIERLQQVELATWTASNITDKPSQQQYLRTAKRLFEAGQRLGIDIPGLMKRVNRADKEPEDPPDSWTNL